MPVGGVPVVIAENGLGFPVRPVEAGYPLLQIAENGMGAPIVISDLGTPFIVQGYEPPVEGFALSGDDDANILSDDNEPVETF